MWDDLAHHRAVGKGLEATGKPVGELLHEHSSILATLRAGGMFALAGHVLVLINGAYGSRLARLAQLDLQNGFAARF